MERSSMFLGRKNQYCENDFTTKCNLQIQCDPIKVPMTFFTELEQKISQFIWKHKTPNSQSSLKKEKWSWRNQPSWLQTTLQSYRHQDSMVLAQKQKYRPVEQYRKPRNKSTYLWVPYFSEKRQEYTTIGKNSLFNKWCWGNWTAPCKSEIRTLPNAIHKDKL